MKLESLAKRVTCKMLRTYSIQRNYTCNFLLCRSVLPLDYTTIVAKLQVSYKPTLFSKHGTSNQCRKNECSMFRKTSGVIRY